MVMGNTGITRKMKRGRFDMQLSSSKLTSKYQATIPEPVRKILHLDAGDSLAFDIDDGQVRLRKANPIDVAFTQSIESTLEEWVSEADELAYHDL
jgi:antitoxin PrlF